MLRRYISFCYKQKMMYFGNSIRLIVDVTFLNYIFLFWWTGKKNEEASDIGVDLVLQMVLQMSTLRYIIWQVTKL